MRPRHRRPLRLDRGGFSGKVDGPPGDVLDRPRPPPHDPITRKATAMNRALRLLVGSLLIGIGATPARAGDDPSALPRSTPERQGVASSAILGFVDAADARLDSLHSFMMVRHGNVVAEGWWAPYGPESRHELYSLSKSFTSTAVGLAISEGKLSLDRRPGPGSSSPTTPRPSPGREPQVDAGPRPASACPPAIRPRPKLGIGPEALWTKNVPRAPGPVQAGVALPVQHAGHLTWLSAIVQKVTGHTVLDYLKPRLFEPLGIAEPTWEATPQGISLGGYGLSVRTEDIAKFGQLYLQKGNWRGKQLVPAGWVEEATARQTSNGSNPLSDWDQGYGYQFWRSRNGAYRGDGAFGQFCVVLPEQDAVVAITSGLNDLQGVLNLVWEKLLPALKPEAISEDPESVGRLQARLKTLTIRRPKGMGSSPTLAEVAGKTYAFPANERNLESIRVEPGPGPGDLAIVVKAGGKEQTIEAGGEGWTKGTYTYLPAGDKNPLAPRPGTRKIATSGAWVAADTYEARVVAYETPFVRTLRLRFAGDELFHDSEVNVRGKEPGLVGRRQ